MEENINHSAPAQLFSTDEEQMEFSKTLKKEIKRKTQQREAQKKYKKIGANFKLEEAEKIESKIAEKGLTVSQFIKDLVRLNIDELKPTNSNNDALAVCQTQKMELVKRLKASQDELNEFKGMGFTKRLKFLVGLYKA